MSTKVCIFNSTTNLIDVTDGVSVYTGSPATAGAPVVLNSAGALDSSFYNSSPVLATASETLNAGDLVNLYYGTVGLVTTVYVRLASASVSTPYPAMGFVTTSYIAGDPCTVLTTGLVSVPLPGATSSDVGLPVYLSLTPGEVTLTKPVNPDLIQPLGYIYQVTPAVGSPPVGGTATFPFLSFPLAAVNQTPLATTSQPGVVKPDGTTIDVAIDGTINVPIATTSVKGIVKPDGTSITISSGVISATATSIATTSAPGVVKPDGTVITVNGAGLITVPTATTSVLGVVKADGTSVTVASGVLSVPTSTNSVLGLVKPDGTTVHVTAGSLSIPTATTGALGLVKPDGTTIAINGSGVISVTGFLPTSGGTLTGALSVTGGITILGATTGSFIKADGTGATVLSSTNLSDDASIIHGAGYAGYIPLYTGFGSPPLGSPPLSPPLSPPTSTNYIGESHLDDGVTQAGTITSSEPVVVQSHLTASYVLPYTIYSVALGNPLPSPGPTLQGAQAVVSDATAPTYMAPYVSGGTVTCAVICSYDGAASPPIYQWLTH